MYDTSTTINYVGELSKLKQERLNYEDYQWSLCACRITYMACLGIIL